MKVKELIEALQAYPQDLEVCRSGYEGGYAFATVVCPKELILDVHGEWYYGPHEDAEDTYEAEQYPSAARAKAIFIG